MSQTYSDVDASADPGEAVDWQERIAAWSSVAAYKRRTHELLAGADTVLDVGCGPGHDLVAMSGNQGVGVDRSAVMCSRAASRGVTAMQADGSSLPFADGAFEGARADRTIQHVEEPAAVLAEMVRVLRPGALLVVADPDQESLVIQVPGVRQSVLDRLKALRRDVGYRNGRWISRAPALLEGLGTEVTAVEAFPLTLRDPADAFGLPTWPAAWREEGGFTDDELAEWDTAITNAANGFLYSLTFIVIAARTA